MLLAAWREACCALLACVAGLGAALATSPAPLASTSLPSDWPATVPLPRDSRVVRAVSHRVGFALSLRVASAADALAFCRQALTRAGWSVREGSLRPRGALLPGERVRFLGGLSFTRGSGDEESEPGGIDALSGPAGEQLDFNVPRIGLRPAAGTAVEAGLAAPRAQPTPGLALPPSFPLPPGAGRPSLARRGDGVRSAAFDLGPGAAAHEFFRLALPAAGYHVREVWRPDPRAPLRVSRWAFRGHGRVGQVSVHADSDGARVRLRWSEE